jgi:hypothetical protein
MKAPMPKSNLSKTDIEQLIEQKLLELIGDPDSGLQLQKSFVKKIKERLKNNSEQISHKTIAKRYGGR